MARLSGPLSSDRASPAETLIGAMDATAKIMGWGRAECCDLRRCLLSARKGLLLRGDWQK